MRIAITLAAFALIAVVGAAWMVGSQRVADAAPMPTVPLSCADQAQSGANGTTPLDDVIQEAMELACGDDGDGVSDHDPPGVLDDGRNLLPQAGITVEQAVAAAEGAAGGPVGEVELEYRGQMLVFEVDAGTQEVNIDASNGGVVSVTPDD